MSWAQHRAHDIKIFMKMKYLFTNGLVIDFV